MRSKIGPFLHESLPYPNLIGRYTFALPEAIRQGAFHPLRDLEETELTEQEAGVRALMQEEGSA